MCAYINYIFILCVRKIYILIKTCTKIVHVYMYFVSYIYISMYMYVESGTIRFESCMCGNWKLEAYWFARNWTPSTICASVSHAKHSRIVVAKRSGGSSTIPLPDRPVIFPSLDGTQTK